MAVLRRRVPIASTVLTTVAALAYAIAAPPGVGAATPDHGAVGPAAGSSVSWNFAPVGPGASSGGTVEALCAPNLCDPFTLNVTLPEADGAFYATHVATLKVVYTWTSTQPNDMDVFMFAPDGTESGPGSPDNQSTGAGKEVLSVSNPQSGAWTVESHVGVTPAATPAHAVATLTYRTLPTPTAPPLEGGAPAFSDASPPLHYQSTDVLGRENAAEPSLGVDWQTGKAMYMAGTQVSRITFNDSVSPPTANWKDVTPPQQQEVNEDAILFTDHKTGRTFATGLVVAGSNATYSDDDGTTWQQASTPVPHGPDHQSIASGPYAKPLPPLAGSTGYKHAVYYCSQNVAQAAGAFCARSDTGGQSFNPSQKVFGQGTPCGAIHGHIKVSPDGTVYVPQNNCAQSGGGSGQGMALSRDNGATWNYSVVPDSSARPNNTGTDPSIGIGAKNSVYFGYENGNGHPKIAVSHDHGSTWSKSQDVGLAYGIQNSKFAAVVAGDDNRAAFAFLGTTSAGDDQSASFRGTWYLYVAFTYDSGKHWLTVNATPGNPVQRGCIWNGGGSNACRNLLDFNDASVDKDGRVLVAYTDGCKDINFSYASDLGGVQGATHGPSKCDSKPNSFKDTDKVAFDGLARQSCGESLFERHDNDFKNACPRPRVVDVRPGKGTRNVLPRTTVSATFDEILTSRRLRLVGPNGATVAGTVTCNQPCVRVTFTPASALGRGKTYTATVTGGNRVGSGHYTWSFTTSP